ERRARGEDLVLVLELVAVIRLDAVDRVDLVALGEIEQRARADRNDQLAGKRGLRHAPSIAPRPRWPKIRARNQEPSLDRLRSRPAAAAFGFGDTSMTTNRNALPALAAGLATAVLLLGISTDASAQATIGEPGGRTGRCTRSRSWRATRRPASLGLQ